MDQSKELTRLTVYLLHIKDRLNSPVPAKHKIREKEFRDFLRREFKLTNSKLELIKNKQ